MLSRRKAMVEALLIVDVKRRRLLGVERRQAAPFAPLLLQLDAPRDDRRQRQAGTDIVKEVRRETHM